MPACGGGAHRSSDALRQHQASKTATNAVGSRRGHRTFVVLNRLRVGPDLHAKAARSGANRSPPATRAALGLLMANGGDSEHGGPFISSKPFRIARIAIRTTNSDVLPERHSVLGSATNPVCVRHPRWCCTLIAAPVYATQAAARLLTMADAFCVSTTHGATLASMLV